MTLLLDSGIDIHNFSPTAKDIVKIAEADLFIYVGGESDKWVDKVVATAQNKNLKTINLMDELGNLVKEEEVVEGMQHEHEEGEENEYEEGEAHEEGEIHEEHEHEEHENDCQYQYSADLYYFVYYLKFRVFCANRQPVFRFLHKICYPFYIFIV